MALHHVSPGEKVRLPLAMSPGEGRAVALVKTDAFETAQLTLSAGETISPHSVPGYATVHCLEGAVTLESEKAVELGSGDWLYLDRGQLHGVTAREDSSLLLTIFFD